MNREEQDSAVSLAMIRHHDVEFGQKFVDIFRLRFLNPFLGSEGKFQEETKESLEP